ncbi:hypothetical protein GCM10018791_04170 [Streptomyces zaomyceticus]|nr:hypothetical protein GCM10018791_04170 [Streptomyces zaomyceticus]
MAVGAVEEVWPAAVDGAGTGGLPATVGWTCGNEKRNVPVTLGDVRLAPVRTPVGHNRHCQIPSPCCMLPGTPRASGTHVGEWYGGLWAGEECRRTLGGMGLGR